MEPEGSWPQSQVPATCHYLSQFDPVKTPSSHSLKINLNIILPSTSGSPKWYLSLRFPHQNPVYTIPLTSTCHMTRPSHSTRFYQPKNIGWGVQISKLLIRKVIEHTSTYYKRSYFHPQYIHLVNMPMYKHRTARIRTAYIHFILQSRNKK